jgi:hypothetical protein
LGMGVWGCGEEGEWYGGDRSRLWLICRNLNHQLGEFIMGCGGEGGGGLGDV